MGSPGAEHLDRGLHSYPCARLRDWSLQTFWQYPLGTTLLFRQYPGYCTDSISTTAWALKRTRDYEAILERPPNSPLASVKPNCNSPRRVRTRSNNCDCYSEKQVDSASGKAFALPGYGGLRRFGRTSVQDSPRLKKTIFSCRKFGLYQHSLAALEHAKRELGGGLHWQHKTQDKNRLLSSTHRSIRLQFARRMGAQTDTLQWRHIYCPFLYLLLGIGSFPFLYLPLSIGSLEQFWNATTLKL